jgi:hypothetical protein
MNFFQHNENFNAMVLVNVTTLTSHVI